MEIITRKQAQALGLKRYFTGKACPKGHVSERQVNNKACLDCALEYAKKNIAKRTAATRRWKERHPDGFHGIILKYRYGISIVEKNLMLWEQRFQCAACGGRLIEAKKNRIDHCHKTGRVRGILCHGCNVALGYMKENPDLIRKLAAYATEKCVIISSALE